MRLEDPARLKRNVGRRIAEIRRGLGLTQDNVAETLDMSVKYFQRIERGTQNLTLETLAKIANALRVRSLDLLRPAKPRPTTVGRPAAPAKRRRARSPR